jgi:hypothetical protein
MGMPSYEADIRERALDNQIAISVFEGGSAGMAGIGRPVREARKAGSESLKAKRAEAQAAQLQERTRRFVDDRLAWIQETMDVVPLRKKT